MPFTLAELALVVAIAMDEDDVPDLRPDTNLYEEIGMDSMAAVIMVVEIQRRTGIALDEELIPELHTAGQVIGAVQAAQQSYSHA